MARRETATNSKMYRNFFSVRGFCEGFEGGGFGKYLVEVLTSHTFCQTHNRRLRGEGPAVEHDIVRKKMNGR
jgi:hypothetical protein